MAKSKKSRVRLPGSKPADKVAAVNTDPDHDPESGEKRTRCKSLVVEGTKYRTQLNEKFKNRKQWALPDPKEIVSTIPGTVIKIFVKEGQEVKPGDQMLILEAMKMKNKVVFHTAGRIKSIKVSEGEKIPKDHLMLELE